MMAAATRARAAKTLSFRILVHSTDAKRPGLGHDETNGYKMPRGITAVGVDSWI